MGAKNATLSPKVSGYISLVAVEDNARVAAGDVIARIDDGDYRLAVQTARDQIAVQQATIDRLGRQTAAQQAAVDQAKAQLASAKAGATRTDLELKRQQDLATRQINSKAALEQAQANYDQAAASVQSAEAAIDSAMANVDVLKARGRRGARAAIRDDAGKAERDLSFTVIRAPFDGVIGNARCRSATTSADAAPGSGPLVPSSDATSETQLAKVQPGQPVTLWSRRASARSKGRGGERGAGLGSVFSLLRPQRHWHFPRCARPQCVSCAGRVASSRLPGHGPGGSVNLRGAVAGSA